MGKKSKGADFVGKIPKGVWLLISLVVALILWTVLSIIPSTSRCFPNAIKVIGSIQTMVSRGLLFKDIGSSLISVLLGFLIGFVTAVPVAFLMAWYRPVRFIIEPWIQFIRTFHHWLTYHWSLSVLVSVVHLRSSLSGWLHSLQ